ncbi:hypothetical protein KOL70_22905 [Pantoea sp. B270]|uniref:hypothetical protein n=1 Tax=Pantoea sp. B270 TaxID=2836826 RepID=UPI001BFF0537|nr:hypothetical protein [Pantoea sp. B270]MBU6520798.1 hypothetical protein [Pantoea sp. B270]
MEAQVVMGVQVDRVVMALTVRTEETGVMAMAPVMAETAVMEATQEMVEMEAMAEVEAMVEVMAAMAAMEETVEMEETDNHLIPKNDINISPHVGS